MKYSVVSLFSGCGGLDLGFELTGHFRVVWANDLYSPSAGTFSRNLGLRITEDPRASEGRFLLGDIEDADFTALSSAKRIDVVTGGPPCQDFSVIRGSTKRKGIRVKRGRLYMHFVRSLVALQPKVFVFENVKGLLSANGGLAFRQVVEDFENLNLRWPSMCQNHGEITKTANRKNRLKNYVLLFSSVVDFSQLGVPQQRKRVIIVGLRQDLAKNLKLSSVREDAGSKLLGSDSTISSFPLAPIEVFSGQTLDRLQGGYQRLMKEYAPLSDETTSIRSGKYYATVWPMYRFDIWHDYLLVNGLPTSLDEKTKGRVIRRHKKILTELKYWQKASDDLDLADRSPQILHENERIKKRMRFIPPGENHEFVKGTPYEVGGLMSNIYRRVHPLRPSPTVIARGGGGTWGYHYSRNRQKLSNRERARLQTFPDSFLFEGTASDVRRQIGEAVPPLAGKRIATLLGEILDKL